MDLFAKMTTFVRIVESGSISAAAQQLRISSAAVSRQLSTLEEELAVTLVARTTRKMTLTDAGRRYYERCTRILREVDDAQALGHRSDVEGSLRITAPVTFGLAAVGPLVHGLMKDHPGLVVELSLEDRIVDLMPEGFDLAVRVGTAPPESTDLIATNLATYDRVLVASNAYVRRMGAPSSPEALAKHDALMPLVGADTWSLSDGEREVRVRPTTTFRSNAFHVLRDLALQGAGIVLVPEWFVAEALAARKLRALLPAWRPPRTVVTAIYRKEQRGTPRIRATIEHLRKGLAPIDRSRAITTPQRARV